MDARFAEGAGNSGVLTGGAGRAWDNGNFFHCLINGIYNIEKDKDGLTIGAPVKMADFPLTELNNVRWRDAVYNLQWRGAGTKIKTVTLDGRPVTKISGRSYADTLKGGHQTGRYRLAENTGTHEVVVEMMK
jgi:hypothetical protein